MGEDTTLLRDYLESGSDRAFSELVNWRPWWQAARWPKPRKVPGLAFHGLNLL